MISTRSISKNSAACTHQLSSSYLLIDVWWQRKKTLPDLVGDLVGSMVVDLAGARVTVHEW